MSVKNVLVQMCAQVALHHTYTGMEVVFIIVLLKPITILMEPMMSVWIVPHPAKNV